MTTKDKIFLTIILAQLVCFFTWVGNCARAESREIVVPFDMDGSGRPYVDVVIDGHKLRALLDTGSSTTLIKHTAVPNGKDGSVTDFHGGHEHVQELNLKVCLANVCEYEEVDATPSLSEDAILRGSFLNTFTSARWDFRARTITLGGR